MNSEKIIIGYSVKCDEELNPPDAVARNEYRARLTVHYIEVTSENLFSRSDNDFRSNDSPDE